MSNILTILHSFLPPKPILNRTSDSGWLGVQVWELDKSLIVEEDKHKSPPIKHPKEEYKQTITIPEYETF